MFGRVMTAMVTPFKGDDVNYKEAARYARFLAENGSDSLLVCGSTGENPTMTKEEKLRLIDTVRNAVDIPVMAGTGTFNTRESLEFTKEVDKLGVDAFLVVTPYYNKPNQEGIYEHFKAVAGGTEKPVMLYNIPGRSVREISVDTIIRLSAISNIRYLKAACGNLDNVSLTRAGTPEDFIIYSGDDSLTLPMLAIGGRGVVSVASSIIGKEINEMIAAYEAGDVKKAMALHHENYDAFRDLFCDTNPVPVKYALSRMGFDTEEVRLPMVPLKDQHKQLINGMLKRHGLI